MFAQPDEKWPISPSGSVTELGKQIVATSGKENQ
jgi:hypothetical protein